MSWTIPTALVICPGQYPTARSSTNNTLNTLGFTGKEITYVQPDEVLMEMNNIIISSVHAHKASEGAGHQSPGRGADDDEEGKIIKSVEPGKADTVDFPTRLRAWMMGLPGHPMDGL